jgi:DNA-binding MarR family transcriptional regulator
MAIENYRRELEEKKAESTLQLLFRTARLTSEYAVARANESKASHKLRGAHMQLVPHIALEGTRQTELAQRVGISKQAVGQLVDELEIEGFLERVPDPRDRRAKLVRFSRKGRADMLRGLQLLNELQRELEQVVGAKQMARIHQTLLAVLAVVEQRNSCPSP